MAALEKDLAAADERNRSLELRLQQQQALAAAAVSPLVSVYDEVRVGATMIGIGF